MLENMKKFPEEINWWNQINTLLTKYQITWEEAEDTPKERFRIYVRKKIENDLRKECKEKEKTTNLVYTTFKTQEYLLHIYPKQARIICQARSKSLDIIKEHRIHRPEL